MLSTRLLCISLLASLGLANESNLQLDLVKRQNTDAQSPSSSITIPTTTSIDSSTSSNTNSQAAASSSSPSTDTITASPSASTSSPSTRPLTTALTIPQNAPAGGISLISPAPAITAYYPIGSPITFIWNYTSLLAPPSGINILVSNTASTYTLTQNASVAPTGTYVWDTEQYATAQNPLINAWYTFAVVDAGSAATAVPKPGHLAANGFVAPFGVYATQSVSVEAVYECVTCSAAMADAERRTIGFLLSMVGVTLLSFTYFSHDFMGGW